MSPLKQRTKNKKNKQKKKKQSNFFPTLGVVQAFRIADSEPKTAANKLGAASLDRPPARVKKKVDETDAEVVSVFSCLM